MIDISVRIHDKFSIEFKIGYRTLRDVDVNKFTVNTWIFIPYSLDINQATYPQSVFYRNIKTNIRFITPDYPLKEIADINSEPVVFLKNALVRFAGNPVDSMVKDYEYNIKMFSAIVKSAIRDDIMLMMHSHPEESMCNDIISNAEKILEIYRSFSTIIENSKMSTEYARYYSFGDEFLSNVLHRQMLRMITFLEKKEQELYVAIKDTVFKALADEVEYRKRKGYMVIDKENPDNNQSLIYRSGALKRYIESELFLGVNKKKDGVFIEQIYMSLAAGLSMVFATIIAFSVQQRFGNFTMPLFVALVVSYMLKDRIKELMRYYFAHRLKEKYFDNKISISLGDSKIGLSREGVDYIKDTQVPASIMSIRNRTPLLEAENRYSKETILLYRKSVRLSRYQLDKSSGFYISGINEILKFNVSDILSKSDDPNVPLYIVHSSGEYEEVLASKMYFMNIVIHFKDAECDFCKKYLISFNREGIRAIDEIN